MWLLVVDRPYYPSVEEYDTKGDAERALADFLAEEPDEGRHDATLYVAEVSRRRVVHTHH